MCMMFLIRLPAEQGWFLLDNASMQQAQWILPSLPVTLNLLLLL